MKVTNRLKMGSHAGWLVLLGLLLGNGLPSNAQVYGGNARPQAAPPAPAGSLVTQTVYGFLDFTTTIGNTLMIFSPNSAPPPAPPSTEKPSTIKPVIEVKPPSNIAAAEDKLQVIQPSKPNHKEPPKAVEQKITTKVSVKESSPVKVQSKTLYNVNKSAEQKKIVSKVEVVAGPSKIVQVPQQKSIVTKIEVKDGSNIVKQNNKEKPIPAKIQPPAILSSRVEIHQSPSQSSVKTQPLLSSIVEVHSSSSDDLENDDEPAILVPNNNIGEPEYDFLSRQPSEVVEETYKVINIRPSKSHHKAKNGHKHRAHAPAPQNVDDDDHPVGLVTTLGGTIVKDGATTIHETSVIGTFLNGKYAQVLHSTSRVFQPAIHKPKIAPSPSLRILKTAAPSIPKNHRYNLEPTPAASINEETSIPYENSFSKPSRRANPGGNFKNRKRNHNNAEDDLEIQNTATVSHQKKPKNRNSGGGQRPFSNRFGRASNTPELATVSVFSEPATPAYSNRRKSNRNKSSASVISSSNDNYSRRGFKPRVQASPVEAVSNAASTSLYKFKLNRAPGRWQYKTTPKPRVTIRKIMGEDEPQTTPSSISTGDDLQNDVTPQARADSDLELSGSHNGDSLVDGDDEDNSIEKSPPIETIKVEISTPADFKDIYYEIATIKSPYTFQVGTVKNTRYITVTSTYEKSFEPSYVPNIQNSPSDGPLTENILASPTIYDKEHNLLETSIATLPPIYLSGLAETPPLETIIDTFSTTQNMLKTHILPVIRDGNNTSSYTLIQTYHITRLVTATKTLPPMEVYQFVPSKTLKEFNSRLDEAGSELHLELEFGDDNEQDEDGHFTRVFPPDLDLANVGSNFDLSDIDKTNLLRLKKAHSHNNPKAQQITEPPPPSTPALTPEQAQQLAFLRLLNPAAAAQIPNVITTSKPVVKLETIYESHVIPIFNGKDTISSIISRPIATVTKTEYEIGTSTILAPLPVPPINQLYPQQQQQFQLTSTPVIQHTEVVATDSKVLKLTFGAKTAYTTLYSTRLVPTVLTSYVTQSLPVQPTAAFPGYFPAPYPPFPYVG